MVNIDYDGEAQAMNLKTQDKKKQQGEIWLSLFNSICSAYPE